MNHSLFIVFLGLTLVGCSNTTPIVPAAQREVLRKILVPEFVAASVPKEKEEEFFRVLEAFNAGRRNNEFVRSVEFKSPLEAWVRFSNGLHGGTAHMKKKDGRWTLDSRFYAS